KGYQERSSARPDRGGSTLRCPAPGIRTAEHDLPGRDSLPGAAIAVVSLFFISYRHVDSVLSIAPWNRVETARVASVAQELPADRVCGCLDVDSAHVFRGSSCGRRKGQPSPRGVEGLPPKRRRRQPSCVETRRWAIEGAGYMQRTGRAADEQVCQLKVLCEVAQAATGLEDGMIDT